MLEFIKAKKNYLLVIAILFVVITLSETTYSLFLTSNKTDEFGYNTGLLDLQIKEDKPITLNNTFPTNDSEVNNDNLYNLTIKNIGTISYLFDLKMVNTDTSGNVIPDRYIKVKVNDNTPINLYNKDNLIASNILINPGEEMTFKINVWLDIDTPNTVLGKSYTAKIITTGTSFYKTVDTTGANAPILEENMIPVSYNNELNSWITSDKTNTNKNNPWYNYDNKEWANSIVVKDSDKYIYDITRNNDIKINNVKYNNGNLIIQDKYLDIGLSNYKYQNISNIIRFKTNDSSEKAYLISNGSVSYYYDNNLKLFIFKNDNKTVSASYNIDPNTWYIVGYTYDGNEVSFYVNGSKINTINITGSINSNNSFKLGTDETFKKVSNITIGDILIYNRILSQDEISKNYQTSINIIKEGLVSGYTEFIPMTLKEYYMSRNTEVIVKEDDILAQYVWIPRYKYRLWNATGSMDIDTYDAYHKGIDISFENAITNSDNIYCENDKCYQDIEHTKEITIEDNGKYYTHPAFSNKETTGFWVSKYGIDKSTSNDAITNIEWGAIVYLMHSKYGEYSKEKDIDSTTGNQYGIFNILSNEYIKDINNYPLGTATEETKTKDGYWYNKD